MGHEISAGCNCGYFVPHLRIGGGRTDFITHCSHPALCETGQHLVTVNLKAEAISCPDGHAGQPRPYFNSPELQVNSGADSISDWQGRKLNDGPYLCPSCGAYALYFAHPHLFFD